MSVTCVWDGVNLQAGGYSLIAFEPGPSPRTWDEVKNYGATYNRQVNVQTSDLVQMHIEVRVTAASYAAFKVLLDAIEAICAKASATLTYSPDSDTTTYTYTTVYSPNCVYTRDDSLLVNKFTSYVTVEPMRRP